nr:hypothetical protein [Tanacetum cinerariifolium]
MYKLREDVRNIREELAEYIDSPIRNCPTFFYDEDEEYTIQYREYLEKSPDAVTTILPTEEPEHSVSMGYEHLCITPETESEKVTESNAKNLLLIPSECEVTLEDKIECDKPAKDAYSSIFMTFSNPLFDEDEINSDKLDPHCFNVESDFVESLLNRDTFIDFSSKFGFSGELAHSKPEIPKFDFDFEEEIRLIENLLYDNSFPRLPEELNAEIADTIIESIPLLPIPVQDEEADLFLGSDNSIPSDIENVADDLEGDIPFLEKLLIDDSIFLMSHLILVLRIPLTTILPTEEPEHSLSMGYEHLSITPETKSEKVTESNAKNLLPIPRRIDIVTETDDVLPPSNENDDDLLNDSLLEEADLFLVSDNSIPSDIENVADDPEGDIPFLEKLLIDDSIFSDESFDSSFEDSPLILRPPPEPPDDELDLEPDSGKDISAVVNKDASDDENDDCCSFMFVIRIFLPYLILPEISSLLLSAESEDTIFDPGISD